MSVSIVVPMYNLEHYVTPLLHSLLEQSEKRFEVILVDDGSTDRTYAVVNSFLEQHPGLQAKLIRTANAGVSAARNTGLAAAAGDYVLFLDGDDYADSSLVRRIGSSAGPDVICWGYNLVREDQSTIVSFTSAASDTTGSEALQNIFMHKSLRIWTGSIAYKRSFLLDHGILYTERCVNGEDQEFIYKALSRAVRVVSIPEVLSYYVQRTSSITGTYNVSKFDVVAAFKRVDEYFRAHPFSEAAAISELLMNREMTENYFYNLKTCLNGTTGADIRSLLEDIGRAYPGLPQEMKLIMKHYQGDDRQLALHIKAFLISPPLYARLIRLDRSWIQFKHKLKTVISRKEIKI
jgi:glycosyltransferase involved in cell wall biosynthesis